MDEQRFDNAARALAASGTRRRALLGALGVGAAGIAAAFRARGGAVAGTQPLCAGEGDPCTIWGGCCDDLTCVGTATNPNNGLCVAGVPRQVVDDDDDGARRSGTPTPRATRTPKPTKVPKTAKTPKPTRTPEPTRVPREPRVEVVPRCNGAFEVTEIVNNTDRPISLVSIRTLAPPRVVYPPTEGSRVIPAGSSLKLFSGPGAPDDSDDERTFSKSKVYSSSRREGAIVETQGGGTVKALCKERNEGQERPKKDVKRKKDKGRE